MFVVVTPIDFPVRFEGVTYYKGDTFEMAEKEVDKNLLDVVALVHAEPEVKKGKKATGKEA